ncbi:hypothetical protein [uncultured Croceitalea sp.]|uniref:hypothetical protein n=1 Tax=uncultured Croceitalea sp. TaxID=1798908 RepID=UPI00374E97D5
MLWKKTHQAAKVFEYSRVGNTNWQTAAVIGARELFTVFSWDCTGFDWGMFTQPLYFQLPINHIYGINSGSTKVESAAYLHEAFKAFDIWYKNNNPCQTSHTAMEQKLLEYIKDEFEENGGKVNLEPPLGFTGEITPFSTEIFGYGNCDQ